MYTPAILFAFSGIVVGLGMLFTTEAIFGEMATAGHLWFDCWNVLLQGGWTLFNHAVAVLRSVANLAREQAERSLLHGGFGHLPYLQLLC